MPQLRVARADSLTDPAERAHVNFSSAEVNGGKLDDWFIGRERSCRMCIADASVSRQHLQVVYRGGAFHLRNVGQFGSEIDGRRVSASDPPVTVHGNLSVKVGNVNLRCTLLADRDADARVDVNFAAGQSQANELWLAPAEAAWRAPAGDPFHAEPIAVPSAADWNTGQERLPSAFGVRPHEPILEAPLDQLFGRAQTEAANPAESVDWTAGLPHERPTKPPIVASPVPSPEAVRDAMPPDGLQSVTSAHEVVAAIFTSAGLRADVAALHAGECPPERIGALLSQLLSGLMATLATRRTVKNNLRVAHTEMHVEGNNPLKRAVTPGEALIALVHAERPGYLSAEQAITSVFKDLADHELAVVDGIEGALNQVVELMNPTLIEQASAEPESKSLLSLRHSREVRLWGQYRARFNEMLGGGRAFSNHFLPAFRETYDACLAKLRRRPK